MVPFYRTSDVSTLRHGRIAMWMCLHLDNDLHCFGQVQRHREGIDILNNKVLVYFESNLNVFFALDLNTVFLLFVRLFYIRSTVFSYYESYYTLDLLFYFMLRVRNIM